MSAMLPSSKVAECIGEPPIDISSTGREANPFANPSKELAEMIVTAMWRKCQHEKIGINLLEYGVALPFGYSAPKEWVEEIRAKGRLSESTRVPPCIEMAVCGERGRGHRAQTEGCTYSDSRPRSG
jgi:hypothetical protein